MEQIFKTVRRTWLERLFGWPWNPFKATRQERDWAAELSHVRRHPQVRTVPPPYIRSVQRAPAQHVAAQVCPPAPATPRWEQDRRVDDSFSPVLVAALASLVSKPDDDTPVPPVEFRSGSGGQYAGGGASGSWEEPEPEKPSTTSADDTSCSADASDSSSDSSSSDSSSSD